MLKAFRLLLLPVIVASCALLAAAQNPASPAPAAQPPKPTLAPSPSLVKDSRCYELRTYYALPGKLEDLHARFRNHTVKFFKKHGMEIVGFWGPADKEAGSENKLVYLLAYPSREAREQAWRTFRADPDWQAAQKKSEENGKLVEKLESTILMATDYSPVK